MTKNTMEPFITSSINRSDKLTLHTIWEAEISDCDDNDDNDNDVDNEDGDNEDGDDDGDGLQPSQPNRG